MKDVKRQLVLSWRGDSDTKILAFGGLRTKDWAFKYMKKFKGINSSSVLQRTYYEPGSQALSQTLKDQRRTYIILFVKVLTNVLIVSIHYS